MGLFRRKKRGPLQREAEFEKNLLSETSPFAVQEAYKTLRTNIIFSVPGEDCKKIVITSSAQGEAKSTTAVNLGIAFAQNASRTLLIDCDLRLPTDALKLGVAEKPGLTNVLVGMNPVGDAIHHLHNGLDFMPAGDIPPNPTELLGSGTMKQMLDALSKYYEYIILDTPPVCTVADASILAKFTSGVVIIVRQNLADQNMVSAALQKLEFADAKILGFVFTGVENEKTKSYRKKGGYSYGYAASAATAAKAKKVKQNHGSN